MNWILNPQGMNRTSVDFPALEEWRIILLKQFEHNHERIKTYIDFSWEK